MADTGFRLGIDFGTSNTVAVLRWPDGRSKALLFDGSPLLPSAVYAAEDGAILTGRDAVHSARLHPHRFEPYPKRRIDETSVYLGDREIPSTELIATVLRRLAGEARRVAGAEPAEVTLTHPAAWGPQRRDALSRAAIAAGLPTPQLVAEPVAAASYFVGTVGTHLPAGGYAVVYDFGAGTFDATLVRRTAGGGFDVLATEGLTDAGGLDVDAAIVTYLGTQVADQAPDEWRRLSQPADDADRRAAWQLWEDARHAKETLSRADSTYVHVPLIDDSVPVTREQLDQLARPILDRTITATLLATSAGGVTSERLSAIFLVGGSSRIPLAATLLHRAFGIAPAAIEQPELVVAEGALVSGLEPTEGAGPRPVAPAGAGPAAPASPGPATPASPGPMMPASPGPTMPASPGPAPAGPPPTVNPPPIPRPAPPLPPRQPVHTGPQTRTIPVPPVAPVPPPPPPFPTMPVAVPPPPRDRSRALLFSGLAAAGLAVVLVIAGVVYALIPSEKPKPPPTVPSAQAACGYKIAYLGILSGSNRGDGETIRNATRLALDRYNNDHDGCTAELVQYDTKGDPDEAARLADDIARDDKILGVVGPVFYAESQKVMPILNAAGVTVIAPSLSYPSLTQRDWRTFHRIVGTDLDQATAGAKYLTSNLRAQRVFIVADNDEHGAAVASEARLRLNTAFAGRADITGEEKDFASVVTQITSATANAVYLATYYDAATILVKAIRAVRPDVKILGWDRMFTDAFVTGAGKDAEGVILTCPCLPPSEARDNFAAEYKSHFAQAGYFGPEAYDAANVLLAALGAGKATRADVLKFVNAYDREGVARRIKFTDKGELGTPANIWAYVVRGGGVTKDQVVAP